MRSSSLACIALSLTLAFVASCRARSPYLIDDGGRPDFGPTADLDSDGDGMCDVTEYQRRTDPFNPDTDGDGFSDYVEAQNGTSPTDATRPQLSLMALMSESPEATLDLPIAFNEYGVGETFIGEIVRLPLNIIDDGTTAQTFFTGAEASFASPMPNVGGGVRGSSFLGVVGRTLLVSSMHFAQLQPPRGCMRGYPFGYQLKTSTGSIRAYVERWLVLLPPGMSIGGANARWCGPTQLRCI